MGLLGALLLIGCMHFGAVVSFGQALPPSPPGPDDELVAPKPVEVLPPPELRLNTETPLQGPGRLAERGNVVEKVTRAWRLGQEGRWPIAVSLLQSIIDIGDRGNMYLIDKRTYINSREFVHRVIEVKLPIEGRQAYRDCYGPLARKLLSGAVETMDSEQALDVANRFLNTTAGAEAAELAGDWLMNQGRYRDAAMAYQRLVRVRPGNHDPAPAVYAKLAFCYGRLGQASRIPGLNTKASPMTRAAMLPFGGMNRTLKAVLNDLATEGGTVSLDAVGEPANDWITLGGAPDRSRVMRGAKVSIKKRWSKSIVKGGGAKPPVSRHPRQPKPQHREVIAAARDDIVIVFRDGHVVCRDIYTGETRWAYRAEKTSRTRLRYNVYDVQREDAVAVISDGGVFYCGRMASMNRYVRPGRPQVKRQQAYLKARVAATGKLMWEAVRANRKVTIEDGVVVGEMLMDMVFVGVPVVADGALYVVATADGDVLYLLKFDASNGKLLWRRYLSSGTASCSTRVRWGVGQITIPPSVMPSVSEGQVVVVANNGLVMSLYAESGKFNWVVRYESNVKPPQTSRGRSIGRRTVLPAKPLNAPVIAGGRVVFLPHDSDRLHCLDATDGSPLWQSSLMKSPKYLLGVCDGMAIVAGDKLSFIDLATGKMVRGTSLPEILGRPALTDKGVWFSTKGYLIRANLRTGKLDRRIAQLPGAKADELGALLFVRNKLVATSANRITAYFRFEDSYGELTSRLAVAERKAPLYLSRAKVCSGGQEFERAIADYDKCLAIADPVRDKETVREARRMLFETYLDYGANTGGPNAIKHLDKAAAYPHKPSHHVRLHLQYAASFEKMRKFPQAVDHFRTMFIKWPMHSHRFVVGKQQSDVAIGVHVEKRVGDLIKTHGQKVYRKYDLEAKALYKKAMAAKSPVDLKKIVDRYPNSLWKPLAWLNAGRFELVAGKINDARVAFRRAESTALNLQQKTEALAGQFAAVEARGKKPAYLRRARRILEDIVLVVAKNPSLRVPVRGKPNVALVWAKALLSKKYKDIPPGGVIGEDPSSLASLADGILAGKPAWASKPVAESLLHPIYYGTGGDDNIVLTRDVKGTVSAFGVRSGKRLWRSSMPGGSRGKKSKAAIYDNLLVICDADRVAAFRLDKSGKLAWTHSVTRLRGNYHQAIRAAVGNVAFNNSVQFAFTPDAVIVLAISGEVKSLDVQTGKLRFQVKSKQYTCGAPAGNEDAVAYMTAGNRKLVVLDAMTGHELFSVASREQWGERRLRAIHMDDEHVMVEMDGQFRCYDVRNGKLLWSQLLAAATNAHYPLVWVLAQTEDVVVLGTIDAKMKAINKQSGRLLWEQKYQMISRSIGNYPLRAGMSDTDLFVVVAQTNAIVTRNTGQVVLEPTIYSYGLLTGKLNWKASLRDKMRGPALLSKPLITAKHVITTARSCVYSGRKNKITSEVRMFELVTGKLVNTKIKSGSYSRNSDMLRYGNILPGAQARGGTLVVDGGKGLTAYRKVDK